ncbi:RidA family protein [Nonomuraea sp. NPDC004702]
MRSPLLHAWSMSPDRFRRRRTAASQTDLPSQCRQVWANLAAALAHHGMGLSDLVKVTTFLSDRAYQEENSAIRREVLGEHAPALTVIITGIYDEAWLLEVEAVAAR